MTPLPRGFWWGCLVNLLCLSGHQSGVLIPGYLASRDLARWELGLADGAFWTAAVLVQPWVGPRLDREGPRRMLIAAPLAMGLLSALFPLAPVALPVVLALRFAQGAALAIYMTAVWTWAASLGEPAQLTRVFGLFGISGLLPNAIGPSVGEAARTISGYGAFFALAAFVEVLAGLLAFRLVDVSAPRRADAGARDFRGALASPALSGAVATALCFGVLTGSLAAFLAPFLLMLGLAGVAAYWTAYTVASIVVRVGGMRVAERTEPQHLIVGPVCTMALGFALLALVQPSGPSGFPLLVLAGLLAGGGHGFLYPAFNTLAVRRLGADARGVALAVTNLSNNFGGAAGAPLAGLVAQLAGYRGMWVAVAAAGFATALAFPTLERRR